MTTKERNSKSKKLGKVIKVSGLNTIKVNVSTKLREKHIGKVISQTKGYLVHIEDTKTVKPGDFVEIVECRPISKTKNWRFNKIISDLTTRGKK